MKKVLFFAGMLMTSQLCSAQRVVEGTFGSWDYPNHSVETAQDFVVYGCTERDPNTGLLSPMFKITLTNGTNWGSFNLDFPDEVILMDFALRLNAGTVPRIILTGMTTDPNNPYKMYVAEVDFTGNMIQSSFFTDPAGEYLIPHQVIYSTTQNGRVIVVGTKAAGSFSGLPPNAVAKKGFVMVLDANNYGVVPVFQEMNSPNIAGGSDNDMLESVCEMPGTGYFITGSANNPQANEQNLLTMGIDYNGVVLHSSIFDNTNFQYMGASVHYRPSTAAQPVVYVLANNSAGHTFEIAAFNGLTGVPGPFYRYNITNIVPPGSGIDVNGFRLQLTANNQPLVTGYISAPTGVLPELLTPFQMLFSANLNTYIQGKFYPASNNNNSPLNGYFSEAGNSVYANTPDVVAYNSISAKTYVINPNTGTGYDVSTSNPSVVSGCEKGLKTQQVVMQVPLVGHASHPNVQVNKNPYIFPKTPRNIHDGVLCPFAIMPNPSGGTATLSPNPATTELAVSLDTEIRDIIVTDMKGNVVLKAVPSERSKMAAALDISGLKPGVYFVDITNAEGIIEREKFIKQ